MLHRPDVKACLRVHDVVFGPRREPACSACLQCVPSQGLPPRACLPGLASHGLDPMGSASSVYLPKLGSQPPLPSACNHCLQCLPLVISVSDRHQWLCSPPAPLP